MSTGFLVCFLVNYMKFRSKVQAPRPRDNYDQLGFYRQEEARTLPFKDTSSLQDIHFKFNRYDLDEDSRSTLRKNASYLKANSSAIIEIQGHCDERGTNNYNVALGERRAHSTKMYLVSQGVSARRIHTISYGEERPFCFDSNAACWQKNRRAHFRISK